MSAFTKLNKQDAFVVPYTAHRRFSVASTLNSGSIGTSFYLGTRDTGSLFNTTQSASNGEYERLIFSSVNHLYYSNFITASYESGSYENYNPTTLHYSRSISHTDGDHIFVFSLKRERVGEAVNPSTFNFYSASFKIQDDSEGNLIISSSSNLKQIASSSLSASTVIDTQTENLNPNMGASTASDLNVDASGYWTTYTLVGVDYNGSAATSPLQIDGTTQTSSIPAAYVSTYLSFTAADNLKSSSTSKVSFDTGVTPDGDITFTWESSSIQNLAVTTILAQSQSFTAGDIVGNIFYPHGIAVVTDSNLAAHIWYAEQYSSSFSFENSYTIFEHQYRCRIKENEFNYSQNPSIKSGSNGDVYSYATGSYFQPYITTVGLYNDSNELIAVGKLGQPVPKSRYTDMTFVIKFDT